MKKLALEGIDGCGKTTVSEALIEKLSHEDINARSVALFRIANGELGVDVYDLWNTQDGPATVRYITNLENELTQKAKDEDIDVLIFDRHWISGRSFTKNTASDQFWLKEGLQPISTAYLRVSPEVSLTRKAEDLDESWMNIVDLQADVDVYERAIRDTPENILGIYRSDDTTAEQITNNIMWDLRIRR